MIAVRGVNPAEAVWLRKCGVDSRSLKHFRCALDDDPAMQSICRLLGLAEGPMSTADKALPAAHLPASPRRQLHRVHWFEGVSDGADSPVHET